MLKNKKVFAVLMAVLAVCVACVFCFTACDAVVSNECNCDCGCENCTCNHDDTAEGGTENRDVQTYRFEAEEAELYADEAEMIYWLNNDVFQGSYITGMGFIFDVQEDDTASGEMSVGYLAHNNPTVTFVITSDIATTATLTLAAASCDVNSEGISSVFGLMGAGINSYSGADHDILTVNGASVALSGTLEGSDSVFSTDGLAMNNWGELTAEIELVEGANVIVLTHDGAGVNFDFIELETTGILSFNATDNDGFTYLPNGEYEPSDEEPEPEPDDRKIADSYDNSTIFEAEDAVLFNSSSSSASSISLIGSEETTLTDGTEITNVMNFNIPGDKIVFQLQTSAAISDVGIRITAASAGMKIMGTYTFEDNNEILTVNGGNPIALDGTLSNGFLDYTAYGELTGVIDLVAGINYIVITAGPSASSTGYLNVDKIELGWDAVETESDEGTVYSSATITHITTSSELFEANTEDSYARYEAEDAALFKATGSSSVIGTESISSYEDETERTNVCDFNTTGDMIVFQILADEDISDVTITIAAASAGFAIGTYTFTDNNEILTVNGGNPIELDGTLSNSMLNYTAYGELTGTISLVKGINYIVITAGSSASSLGYLNVDYISLAW